MFVEAGDPPLSPLINDGQSELVFDSGQPGDGACDGDAVVNVSLCDPDPESAFDEDGVEPVAGIGKLGIIGCDIVAAGVEASEGDVELCLDGDLVEEMRDAVHVLADDVVGHQGGLSSVGKPHKFSPGGDFYFLVEAFGVEVEHAGIGGIEFFIEDLPYLLAGGAFVAEDACGSHVVDVVFGVVPVVV